jgi:hypothetical protein
MLALCCAAHASVASVPQQLAPPAPFPFEWSTAGARLYSFCSNASGALSPTAVRALSRSKLMIHGMEVGAELQPAWSNSEYKTSLAAKQLRAAAPGQLQLYTVQSE